MGIIFLAVLGGSFFYGTQLDGLKETHHKAVTELAEKSKEAIKDIENIPERAYEESKKEIADVVTKFNDFVGDPEKNTGIYKEIQDKRKTILANLRAIKGNEEKKTGIYEINKEKKKVLDNLVEITGKEKESTGIYEINREKQKILD